MYLLIMYVMYCNAMQCNVVQCNGIHGCIYACMYNVQYLFTADAGETPNPTLVSTAAGLDFGTLGCCMGTARCPGDQTVSLVSRASAA